MKVWNPKIQEALALMRTGLNSVEAGERLGINPATIRAYLFKHPEEREGMVAGRGRPGPGPKTHEALALMRTGIPSREAAKRVGVSSGGIRAYLSRNPDEKHGILPQGGPPKPVLEPKPKAAPASNKKVQAVVERVQRGATLLEASEAEGISLNTVKTTLRRHPELRAGLPKKRRS